MRMPGATWFLLLVLLVGCGDDGGTNLSRTLTLEVSGAAWVAYQDGDGPWRLLVQDAAASPTPALQGAEDAYRQARENFKGGPRRPKSLSRFERLEPLSHGTEHTVAIKDPAGRYGVAHVCVDATGDVDVDIDLYTLGERSSVYAGCFTPGDAPTTYVLSGDVSGLNAGEQGAVYAGFEEDSFDASESRYALELERNFYDLIAIKSTLGVPNKIIVKSNLAVNSNQTLALDFGGADAFVPETRTVTVTGAKEGDDIFGGVSVRTEDYTYAELAYAGDANTFGYAVLPQALLGENGFYDVFAAGSTDINESGTYVGLARTFTAPEDVTLALPPPLEATVRVERQTPYVRPAATWSAYPVAGAEYTNFYDRAVEGLGETATLSYFVSFGREWSGAASAFSYALPNFDGVEGWKNDWNFVEGEEVSWSVGASVEKGDFGEDGSEYVFAIRYGSVIP